MLEGLMALSLVLMGVYFVKSTDLPKELKDRSVQHKTETVVAAKRKMAFQAAETKKIAVKEISNQVLIDLHNKAIDELTFKITTLEQELRTNNERNAEIQKTIDMHLKSLKLLNDKIRTLA